MKFIFSVHINSGWKGLRRQLCDVIIGGPPYPWVIRSKTYRG